MAAANNVIWLGEGIVGDDTDGHIDELARFVGPRTSWPRVEEDPGGRELSTAARQFPAAPNRRPTQRGGRWKSCHCRCRGRSSTTITRLPACYMNFYIANGLVVVPQFDDPADRVALETLGGSFPAGRSAG